MSFGARPLLTRVRSSVARLAFVYLIIVFAGVSVLLTTIFLATQRAIVREADVVLQTETETLREEFADGGVARLITILNRRVDDWGRIGAVYLLVDSSGMSLAGNLSGWPTEARRDGDWLEFELSAREGDELVDHPVRATVLTLAGNRLLVGTDISEQNRVTAQQRTATIWAVALTALLTAASGWWFSRRVAARVRGVAAACENIMSGDLSRRLPSDGSHDEFDQLTVAVNGMLERVEHQTAVLRTTFGSAAHDLRTPLQRIRMRLETSSQLEERAEPMRAAIQQTIADVDRVQRTLATLLQIAHAESGIGEERLQPLDLAHLANELVDLYLPVAREKDLQLTLVCDADAPRPVRGSRQLLAQLLVNLLENALKFVPPGGAIEVRVAADSAGTRLVVSDNGPGMVAGQRDTGQVPVGSGLGLSLVAAVVRLHHGQLRMQDNAPGLAVSCIFPAAA